MSSDGMPDGAPSGRASLLTVAPSRQRPAVRRSLSPTTTAWVAALAVGLAVAAVYTLFAWRQWQLLVSPSWDLGIFSELAKAYANFEAPIVSIKGEGFNLLGDHFHPLLVLTGPLWALWPSGLSLLVLQGALFGLSAVPLARYAIERWGMGFGVALGCAYGLGWGLQSAAVAQFHEIAFAVPILAFALAAYLRGRFLSAAVWAGLLVFVKEDLGLTVAALGATLILSPRHRSDPRARKIGYFLAAWGVLWLVLATAVILPALNPLDQYDYTGRIGHPLEFFVPPIKWLTVLLLIGSAGVIGLRSPLMFLMAPTLAWRFVGTVEHYWGWGWHYSAILMPIAAAALLHALAGEPAPSSTPAPDPADDPAGHPSPALRWGALAIAVAATLAVAFLSRTTMPLTHQIPTVALAQGDFYQPSWRLQAAREVMGSIPEGSTVVTDISLMAYLVPRADVYWLGNTNPAPDYLLLDTQGYHYQSSDQPGAEAWAERTWGIDYVPHAEADGFVVVKRAG